MILCAVPIGLIGVVIPFLYLTETAINVQSILGIIFIIGIKVANTVLMTDFAQEIRRHEGLSPDAAIRKAASVRVRPVPHDRPGRVLRHDPRRPSPSAGAARPTAPWAAPSSAGSWRDW